MTTLNPRGPLTTDELSSLYPPSLQLHLVQIIFRHGERSPVSARFKNTGLTPFWPYCKSAAKFRSAVLEPTGEWSGLEHRRRTETFEKAAGTAIVKSPDGGMDGICLLGDLTDAGRVTTLHLGQRMRKLYVEQLKFLPENMGTESEYYLRATFVPRALESLQQVVTGLYPAVNRSSTSPILTIHQRFFSDENLFPNEHNCKRFRQIMHEFAKLAAEKWNNSPEMQHLQSRLGKHIEDGSAISVDGHPKLSGIMDTVNATLAHGPATKLPEEFYEEEVRKNMNTINVDEWFKGYANSSECRRLGVGSLLGEMLDRMLAATSEVPEKEGRLKIALMGSHDTTIAALLASLGTFDGDWPRFTSSVAFEMFRKKELKQSKSLWNKLTRRGNVGGADDGYYVRLKYNEYPVVIKGCKKPGKHLEGDENFCTLAAFKDIIGKMRPKDWAAECLINLDKTGIPPVEEVE